MLVLVANGQQYTNMRALKIIVFLLLVAVVIHARMYSDNVRKAQAEQARLEAIGYSKNWAHHKAWVEAGLIEKDSLYQAIEED